MLPPCPIKSSIQFHILSISARFKMFASKVSTRVAQRSAVVVRAGAQPVKAVVQIKKYDSIRLMRILVQDLFGIEVDIRFRCAITHSSAYCTNYVFIFVSNNKIFICCKPFLVPRAVVLTVLIQILCLLYSDAGRSSYWSQLSQLRWQMQLWPCLRLLKRVSYSIST